MVEPRPNPGTEVDELALELDSALRAHADPERALREKAYLKSDLEHYGVRVPVIRQTTKKFLKERTVAEHGTTVELVEALWRRPVHELRTAAVETLCERVALLSPVDIPLLERLLRESGTWALVDGLAPHVVGPLAARFPDIEATLWRWADDPDLWLRRAALLAYLLPMRRGEPVFEKFAAIADRLLEDREFFVRKAIGWVLRERSRKAADEVYVWLVPRRQRAARLTLREASKHLSDEQRNEILGL